MVVDVHRPVKETAGERSATGTGTEPSTAMAAGGPGRRARTATVGTGCSEELVLAGSGEGDGDGVHQEHPATASAAVPLADFETKQIIAPPGRLGRVRMLAASRDRNQTAAAEEQQVAIGNMGLCRCQLHESSLVRRR